LPITNTQSPMQWCLKADTISHPFNSLTFSVIFLNNPQTNYSTVLTAMIKFIFMYTTPASYALGIIIILPSIQWIFLIKFIFTDQKRYLNIYTYMFVTLYYTQYEYKTSDYDSSLLAIETRYRILSWFIHVQFLVTATHIRLWICHGSQLIIATNRFC